MTERDIETLSVLGDMDMNTVAIWGDAMCSALLGDRRELVELLRCGITVTQDAAEFLAWLLEERKAHRPPLPEKFKSLHQLVHNPALFEAYHGFVWERDNLENFSYEQKLTEWANLYGVTEETLHNKLQRSSQPRKSRTKRKKASGRT